MRRRRLWTLAGLAGLMAGCGGEPRAAAPDERRLGDLSPPTVAPGTERQVLAERQWLDDVASSAIGDGYACTGVTPRRRPRDAKTNKLVVHVADAGAEDRVRVLAARLSAPTRVQRIAPRWRRSVMRQIKREAESTQPKDAASSVGEVPFMDIERGCPPIQLGYVDGERVAGGAERWAARLQARHGKDRVRIRRMPPPRARMAPWSLAHRPRPGDRTLSLLVRERECASGRTATGRISATTRYTRGAVIVAVRVRPLAGFQTCQSSPPTAFTVALDGRVGRREVVDVSRLRQG